MAVEKGARVISGRVESIRWVEGKPEVSAKKGLPQIYDFVIGVVGVNTNALKIFEGLDFGYTTPEASRTYICELPLGEDLVKQYVAMRCTYSYWTYLAWNSRPSSRRVSTLPLFSLARG